MLKFLNKWFRIAVGDVNMCPLTNAEVECPLHKLCCQLNSMSTVSCVDSTGWQDDNDLQITIDSDSIDSVDDEDIDLKIFTGKIHYHALTRDEVPNEILRAIDHFESFIHHTDDCYKYIIKCDISRLVDDITREKLNQKKNKTKKSIEKKIASDFDIDLSDSNKNK